MINQTPVPIQLSTFWPYQVSYLADQVSRFTTSVAKTEAGLNLSQWRVLAAIAEKPGRTSASVVAVTPMDKGIVSRAVSALLDQGLIAKSADETDKRRFSLLPTPEGAEIYNNIAARLNEAMIDPLSGSISQDQVIDALTAYIQHMQRVSPEKE